jgi:hypothetical protein
LDSVPRLKTSLARYIDFIVFFVLSLKLSIEKRQPN